MKDRKQLDILGDDLSKKSTELNKIESLVGSIENRASPDYDKSKEVDLKKKEGFRFTSNFFFFPLYFRN